MRVCRDCGRTEGEGVEFRERDGTRCADCTRAYYREQMRRLRGRDRESVTEAGGLVPLFERNAARDERLAAACDDPIMRRRLLWSVAFWQRAAREGAA